MAVRFKSARARLSFLLSGPSKGLHLYVIVLTVATVRKWSDFEDTHLLSLFSPKRWRY